MSGDNWCALYRNLSLSCHSMQELDMKTLVWTRGDEMPLALLEKRLKCPTCGTRNVVVIWEIPTQPKRSKMQL
jgi:hypothetical protein